MQPPQTSESIADNSTACKLFNIPLELRKAIYREVLVLVPSKTKDRNNDYRATCHASILRTCHQIHNEALPVLAEENNLSLLIWDGYWRDEKHNQSWEPQSQVGCRVTFNDVELSLQIENQSERSVSNKQDGNTLSGFPRCILHVRSLKIHVYALVQSPRQVVDHWAVPILHRTNDVLSKLMLVLRNNNHLKTLQITIDDQPAQFFGTAGAEVPNERKKVLAAALYPLDLLRDDVEISIIDRAVAMHDLRGHYNGHEVIQDPRKLLREYGRGNKRKASL